MGFEVNSLQRTPSAFCKHAPDAVLGPAEVLSPPSQQQASPRVYGLSERVQNPVVPRSLPNATSLCFGLPRKTSKLGLKKDLK